MFLIKVFQEIGNLGGGKAYADLKGYISQGIVVLGARGDGGLPGGVGADSAGPSSAGRCARRIRSCWSSRSPTPCSTPTWAGGRPSMRGW